MAKASEQQQAVSFDPSTFSSGRWDGGRGTVVADPAPHFEYYGFDTDKGKVTVVNAILSIEDQEGAVHEARYRGFYADTAVIRDSPDNDADEAEQGPSVAARQPGKPLKLRGDSELGQLFASLQTQGYPSTKLNKGDLRVLAGLDAEWVQFARKKDDKYPILIVGEVYGGGGAKSASKPAAATKSKTKPVADEDEDDTPAPKKGSKAKAADSPEDVALEIALEALGDAEDATGEGTTVGDCVRLANKKLKGDPATKKAVLDLFGDDEWIAGQDAFKYKKRTNSIVLVED